MRLPKDNNAFLSLFGSVGRDLFKGVLPPAVGLRIPVFPPFFAVTLIVNINNLF